MLYIFDAVTRFVLNWKFLLVQHVIDKLPFYPDLQLNVCDLPHTFRKKTKKDCGKNNNNVTFFMFYIFRGVT